MLPLFPQEKFEKGEIPGGQVHKVARHLAVVWGGRFVVSSFPTSATDLWMKPPELSKGWSLILRDETFSKVPVG